MVTIQGIGDNREDWDTWFMRIARSVATRSTCPRRYVGTILVQDRSIKGTGYNGAPSGVGSCLDRGCLMRDGHCVRTVHAEANLMLQTDAADRQDATVYATDMPCWNCMNLLVNSGVRRIYYERDYPRHRRRNEQLCAEKGVALQQLVLPDPLPEIDDISAELPVEDFNELR